MWLVLLIYAALYFTMFSNEVDAKPIQYSVSNLYKGTIGKEHITMLLTENDKKITGSYSYNGINKKFLLNGKRIGKTIFLSKDVSQKGAAIKLRFMNGYYRGELCVDNCQPVFLTPVDRFANKLEVKLRTNKFNSNGYGIYISTGGSKQYIKIQDSVDVPSLDFIDLNDDGLHDLIITTDHRPVNGSQNVYISTGKKFKKNEELSNVDGTLYFNSFNRRLVFNARKDCCKEYVKYIYKFEGEKLRLQEKITFNYVSKIGTSNNGNHVLQTDFEAY